MTAEEAKQEIVQEIIRLRQENGWSQKHLGELSGVQQPIIARMETGATTPQLSTMIKLLLPFGKTLAVVPAEDAGKKK